MSIKSKKIVSYSNDYFSVVTPELETYINEKYKNADKINYEKFINTDVKKILQKYEKSSLKPKGCSCNSNCCSNNCCGRSRIENYLTCFFKNYSIVTYDPAQSDLTLFDSGNDININNLEFTIYDSKNAIPRLILPFGLIFGYKTDTTFATVGLTITVTISQFLGNNSVNNVFNINLPATNTLKFYTVLFPCLNIPAAFGQNVIINFRPTDDLNLLLTNNQNVNDQKVYVKMLYHVLAPLNIFSVRSLANSTLFYFQFGQQFTYNLLPSPGINGGVFEIIEYMFGVFKAISNGLGAKALSEATKINANELIILRSKLNQYLEQLRLFIVNTAYLNGNMIDELDDYIISSASSQVLNQYIQLAVSFIEGISGMLALF